MTVVILNTQPVVVTGDFNCIIKERDRRSEGQKTGLDRSSRLLKQIICDHSLMDAGKEAQGPRGNFTHVERMGQTQLHIDFIFLPKAWIIVKDKSTPIFFPDHCLLMVKAEMGSAA